MDNKQNGGWARSPATLVQLAVGSVPRIDPKFFDLVNGVVDNNIPVPANQMVSNLVEVTSKAAEKFFTGGNDEKYKQKYLKYKSKYLNLKKQMESN
jgi:hypothetical protein|uniref:Uncharacterized protein n=1 Tax=viral metagenome TaxID=1070528 RepID=A0A6C0GZP9_9ZZZZ